MACDSNVNVLIGPNNCGKTSVLLALADILISPFEIPRKLLRMDSKFEIGFEVDRTDTSQPDLAISMPPIAVSGSLPIVPGDNKLWTLKKQEELLKTVSPLGFRCFVPALRLNTDFRSQGPTTKADKSSGLPEFILVSDDRQRIGNATEDENPADFLRDSQIVQEIIALDYHAYRKKDTGARKVIDSIFELTSKITEGFPVAFEGIGEDRSGYFIEFGTPDGKVPFNVLSQGTQALIQWIARVVIGMARHYRFPRNLQSKPGILILDEIDAHLHPAWQRNILPALSNYFPNLQIFCSAHSPLLLAGLKRGQIHSIRRNGGGNPVLSTNQQDVSGWSVDEIMTTYYGLFAATDSGTEAGLSRLNELRGKMRLNKKESAELEKLRRNLASNLSTGPVSNSLTELAILMRKASEALPPQKMHMTQKRVKSPTTKKPSRTRV